MRIAIISASIRTGRNSHRVALYLKNYIESKKLAEIDLMDLNDFKFPLFEERLKFQKDPAPETLAFAEKIKHSDGVIIVTPEYNGGYPASLKNVIDLLTDEWKRKPVAISTVSDGIFGGSQVIISLQFTLWKLRALTVPALFSVPKVMEAFDTSGIPVDKTGVEKRVKSFIDEIIWLMQATKSMGA